MKDQLLHQVQQQDHPHQLQGHQHQLLLLEHQHLVLSLPLVPLPPLHQGHSQVVVDANNQLVKKATITQFQTIR